MMVSLRKYNVSVEREAERCTDDGESSDAPYPRSFGDKLNNNFIKMSLDNKQLKILTPACSDVHRCYDKLEEITNVVLCELYSENEMLWPTYTPVCTSKDVAKSLICIRFSLEDTFFEKLKDIYNISKNIDDLYLKLCEKINKKAWMLDGILGQVKAVALKNGIRIKLNNVDFEDKCGFPESYLGFLVAFIFSCIIFDDEIKSVEKYFETVLRADDELGLNLKKYIEEIRVKYQNHCTYVDNFAKIKGKGDFVNTMLDFAKKYSLDGYNSRYSLKEYPKLVSEAVVLIKDAISQGVDYDVLNVEKNIVEFKNNGKSEIIVEGNKTNKDTYIFPFITDDKFYAKRVLTEKGLNTPNGFLINKDMPLIDVSEIINEFVNKPVVIKPRNTNFGIGITVYPEGTTYEYIKKAADYAFGFDSNIILEEYAKGMEYRFLVINGKCLSVAYRRSASVVGNGKSSIKELIELKNKEAWHALTGTPVKMDEPVNEFLRLQGLTLDSIPKNSERITLRKNSNCCTGGESIVITEKMPDRFKKAAERAAGAFNAKICGVDIIIDDLDKEQYSIIEINDMPGYSINEWPYEGRGERIGIEVLKLVNLIK